VKTEPLPDSLATVASPPIIRASFRLIARHKPVPPKRRAANESAWVNSANSFACRAGVVKEGGAFWTTDRGHVRVTKLGG
jgi:hypothetical protein